jgi:hypothetical protein
MSWITETNLLVLGSRVSYQNVLCLEIDRLLIIEYGPDTFTAEDLVAFITGLVYVL